MTFGHYDVPLQVLCMLPRLVWPAYRALCTPVWPVERTVWPQTASHIHTGCIKGRGTLSDPPKQLPWPQSANVCDEHTDTPGHNLIFPVSSSFVPSPSVLVTILPTTLSLREHPSQGLSQIDRSSELIY